MSYVCFIDYNRVIPEVKTEREALELSNHLGLIVNRAFGVSSGNLPTLEEGTLPIRFYHAANFSDFLKNSRRYRQLSAKQLETRSGITQRTIRRIENGENDAIHEDTVRKLCDALGANYDLAQNVPRSLR